MKTLNQANLERTTGKGSTSAFAVALIFTALMVGNTQTAKAVLQPLAINTPQSAMQPVVGGNFSNQPLDFPGPGTIVSITNFGPSVANGNAFTFQGKEIIWRENSTGELTFLFQVENLAGSADSIKRVTLTGFGTLTTEVGFDIRAGVIPVNPADPLSGQNGGTIAPQFTDRSITGNVVGFDFSSPAFDIDAGTTSKWFAVKTNGKLPVGPATIQAIDGGVAFANILLPVPEPATALFGVAICGVMALRQRRLKSN